SFEEVERIRREVEDGKVRVLLCSVAKMGTGVDFLKVFRYAVYMDIPWSFTQYIQSLRGLVRRGVGSSAFVVRLVVERSVDEFLLGLLERKREMFEKAVGEDIEVSVDEVIERI
ncbi:MAG: hypothetical protein KIH08_17005, partial [Candidatus Freyarchaeota archaeon]|nr:hypothetical protein [Candidatus Jordarchaeia archaeon]